VGETAFALPSHAIAPKTKRVKTKLIDFAIADLSPLMPR
jgi:hypothetical protein